LIPFIECRVVSYCVVPISIIFYTIYSIVVGERKERKKLENFHLFNLYFFFFHSFTFQFHFFPIQWATYKNRTYLKGKKCAINKMILVFGVFCNLKKKKQWKCFLVKEINSASKVRIISRWKTHCAVKRIC
jgi:hypothetical protein